MKITNPIGKKGEDIATDFLKKKGYKILDRNFHGRQGEIDIICLKDNTLIFVEVKTRRSAQFGTPLEAIRHTKLSAIEITGQLYKSQHPELPDAMRIDAVAVELDINEKPTKIDHIENIGEF